jgi:hypothetical protein
VLHFITGPLVWSCKKWKVVSLSTKEEKYCGVVHVGTKIVWIRELLSEPCFHVQTLTMIYSNIESAIQVVENHVSHSNMDHAKLHAHYLR